MSNRPSNTRLWWPRSACCRLQRIGAALGWITKVCRSRHGKTIDRQAAQLLVDPGRYKPGLIRNWPTRLRCAVHDATVNRLAGV